MNAERHLGYLSAKAERRLLRLRSLIERFNPPLETEAGRVVAFVTLEALNLWDAFARSYYLSCAFGTKLRSGVLVRFGMPGIDSPASAIREVLVAAKRKVPGGTIQRRYEPSWHDVQI